MRVEGCCDKRSKKKKVINEEHIRNNRTRVKWCVCPSSTSDCLCAHVSPFSSCRITSFFFLFFFWMCGDGCIPSCMFLHYFFLVVWWLVVSSAPVRPSVTIPVAPPLARAAVPYTLEHHQGQRVISTRRMIGAALGIKDMSEYSPFFSFLLSMFASHPHTHTHMNTQIYTHWRSHAYISIYVVQLDFEYFDWLSPLLFHFLRLRFFFFRFFSRCGLILVLLPLLFFFLVVWWIFFSPFLPFFVQKKKTTEHYRHRLPLRSGN